MRAGRGNSWPGSTRLTFFASVSFCGSRNGVVPHAGKRRRWSVATFENGPLAISSSEKAATGCRLVFPRIPPADVPHVSVSAGFGIAWTFGGLDALAIGGDDFTTV